MKLIGRVKAAWDIIRDKQYESPEHRIREAEQAEKRWRDRFDDMCSKSAQELYNAHRAAHMQDAKLAGAEAKLTLAISVMPLSNLKHYYKELRKMGWGE